MRRQVQAYRLVAPLFPDPEDEVEIEAGEGLDCIQAGTLQARAEQRLRERGFEDFKVRLAKGARPAHCTAQLAVATNADGRTLQIDTMAARARRC